MPLDLEFFDQIQKNMDTEGAIKDEIRNAVRELEKTCRSITGILNQVHSSVVSEVPAVIQAASLKFPVIRENINNLSALIPEKQYYRYNDLWARTLQQACFLAASVIYLQHERLITILEIEKIMGVPVNMGNNSADIQNFHIPIEDVLHSFISMISELSRLVINAVTAGDYSRPLRVSRFVRELSTGFQLLNLKNDSLRKRFDGIKYDVKKIEEVVYDISLRGLDKAPEGDTREAVGPTRVSDNP